MSDCLNALMRGSDHVCALALSVGLRATLLYLLALVVLPTLGRSRVLLSTSIGNAYVLGLLLLPLATVAAPPVELVWLPNSDETAALPQRDGATLSVEPAPLAPTETGLAEPALASSRTWRANDASVEPGSAPTPVASQKAKERSDSPPPVRAAGPSVSLRHWIAPVYLAGFGLGLWRWLAGLAALARLRGSSVGVNDPTWIARLAHWRQCLGLRRRVALLQNERIRVPMTAGWFHPVIFVPPTWRTYKPDQRDAALLHELAHVRRADYPWHLLLRLVEAIYWLHPLTWVVHPFLTRLRERACDDLCVYWMSGAVSYRAALLDMARALARRPQPQPGLAVIGSTRLGRRLAQIDRSPGSPHCLSHGPTRAAVTVLVLAAVGLLGAAQLRPSSASEALPFLSEGDPQEAVPAKQLAWNQLDRLRIPAYELKVAGGGDPAKAPAGLVAVLGDSRLKHLSFVSAVSFSPDGKLLASVGGDGTARLWDPATGKERRHWEGGSAGLACVAFSPDGRTVAAGGRNNAVLGVSHWPGAARTPVGRTGVRSRFLARRSFARHRTRA